MEFGSLTHSHTANRNVQDVKIINPWVDVCIGFLNGLGPDLAM